MKLRIFLGKKKDLIFGITKNIGGSPQIFGSFEKPCMKYLGEKMSPKAIEPEGLFGKRGPNYYRDMAQLM